MDIVVLILLTLSPGSHDVYNKVLVMPTPSQRDCVAAGAQWIDTQDSKDSPQYLCLVKSDVSRTEAAK